MKNGAWIFYCCCHRHHAILAVVIHLTLLRWSVKICLPLEKPKQAHWICPLFGLHVYYTIQQENNSIYPHFTSNHISLCQPGTMSYMYFFRRATVVILIRKETNPFSSFPATLVVKVNSCSWIHSRFLYRLFKNRQKISRWAWVFCCFFTQVTARRVLDRLAMRR